MVARLLWARPPLCVRGLGRGDVEDGARQVARGDERGRSAFSIGSRENTKMYKLLAIPGGTRGRRAAVARCSSGGSVDDRWRARPALDERCVFLGFFAARGAPDKHCPHEQQGLEVHVPRPRQEQGAPSVQRPAALWGEAVVGTERGRNP